MGRSNRRIFLVALGIASGLATTTPAGSQTGWKAGVAKIAITPREPIWLAGYAVRNRPSEGVLQDIYAKALALQDESGATSVLITTDILGYNRIMSDTIAERIHKSYGVARARVILNASHTHSAPVTSEVLRPAYDLNDEQKAVIKRYTASLLDQIVEVAGSSIKNLAPARLEFAQGLAGFAVNRRRVRLRHLPGPVDHDVPVLTVRGAEGDLRAVVFGYACHNTTLSGYVISGDYAGFAQEALERDHPGATALFMAGCGADANPLPRGTIDLAKTYGQILATAVDRVLQEKMTPLAGPLNTAFEHVDIPFRKPPAREELLERLKNTGGYERRHAEHLLDVIAREGKLPDRYPYPVQVWQFGPALTMIMLGGEAVVDYSLRFKTRYGWDNVWVAAYSNDVPAYIPSLRVLNEGGYEGATAMIPYGQPGPFGAAVEEIIAEKVDELIQRTRPSK